MGMRRPALIACDSISLCSPLILFGNKITFTTGLFAGRAPLLLLNLARVWGGVRPCVALGEHLHIMLRRSGSWWSCLCVIRSCSRPLA